MPKDQFDHARIQADRRAKESGKKYLKGPKRYIIQELLKIYDNRGEESERLFAAFITNLIKGVFPDATGKALAAIDYIKKRIKTDQEERKMMAEEAERSRVSREQEDDRIKFINVLKNQNARDELLNMFFALCKEIDVQKRGYLFESFLNKLFHQEGIDPRASFRNVGEQIDGSFQWNGQTHLVEAKWVSKPIAGAEFGSLIYKISGKTVDTRGLYLSVNGYSKEALQGLTGKGDLRFVCLDGAHIIRGLGVGQTFIKILTAAWRHASETGEAYFTVDRMSC